MILKWRAPAVLVAVAWGVGLGIGFQGAGWVGVGALAALGGLVGLKGSRRWLGAVMMAGAIWGYLSGRDSMDQANVAWPEPPVSLTMKGVVRRMAPPDQERGDVSVQVLWEAYRNDQDWIALTPIRGRMRVWAEDVEVREGDRIVASGDLERWNHQTFLSVRPARSGKGLRVLETGDGWGKFMAAMRHQRERCVERIWRNMPPSSGPSLWSSSGTQAGVLEGLLLGHDRALRRGEREWFRRTGTMHMMAVSGFNVSVVTGCLFGVLLTFRMSVQLAAGLSLLGVVGLVGLTGATPSVVRAALMSTVVLGGMMGDRRSFPLNALAVVFMGMTWWDPFQLFDIGFQLSFVATLGILMGVMAAGHRLDKWAWWQLAALVTVSAQVAVWPLLWKYFQTASWVSLPINVMVAPLVIAVTLLGGSMILVDVLSAGVAQVMGGTVWVMLTLMIEVVRWGSGWPGASVALPPLPGWGLFGLYSGWAGAWWLWWRHTSTTRMIERL